MTEPVNVQMVFIWGGDPFLNTFYFNLYCDGALSSSPLVFYVPDCLCISLLEKEKLWEAMLEVGNNPGWTQRAILDLHLGSRCWPFPIKQSLMSAPFSMTALWHTTQFCRLHLQHKHKQEFIITQLKISSSLAIIATWPNHHHNS